MSFVMAVIFILMALGLFFLPSGIFEGWTPIQRYAMGGAILAYAGFRLFRAKKMLDKSKMAEKQGIERDE